MDVAVHWEKKENEKTGKREAGEERKQSTAFNRLCRVFQRSFRGQHGEKMVCMSRVSGVIRTFGKATAISIQVKRVRGPHQHFEAVVD